MNSNECPLCLKSLYSQRKVVSHLKNIHKLSEKKIIKLIPKNLCGCNCGKYTSPGKGYIRGHSNKGRPSPLKGRIYKPKPEPQLCECMCGEYASSEKRFIVGHQSRINHPLKGKHHTKESNEKNRQAHLGKKQSEETRKKLSKARLGNKNTLGYKAADDTKKLLQIVQKEIQNRPEVKEKNRKRAKEMHEKGILNVGWPQGESYAEKCYREHLESLGYVKDVDFFQEVRVGTYSLDFVFKDKNIDFEIDGGQHLKPAAVEHDRIRDEYLTSLGMMVMRISAKKLFKLLKINS